MYQTPFKYFACWDAWVTLSIKGLTLDLSLSLDRGVLSSTPVQGSKKFKNLNTLPGKLIQLSQQPSEVIVIFTMNL